MHWIFKKFVYLPELVGNPYYWKKTNTKKYKNLKKENSIIIIDVGHSINFTTNTLYKFELLSFKKMYSDSIKTTLLRVSIIKSSAIEDNLFNDPKSWKYYYFERK